MLLLHVLSQGTELVERQAAGGADEGSDIIFLFLRRLVDHLQLPDHVLEAGPPPHLLNLNLHPLPSASLLQTVTGAMDPQDVAGYCVGRPAGTGLETKDPLLMNAVVIMSSQYTSHFRMQGCH